MNAFNAVCFCVLMDHHRAGVEEAHPAYVIEKFEMFERADELTAFGMLDRANQERVRIWCKTWNVGLP